MLDLDPFPYQLEGAEWLAAKKRALLADEMGLGKTIQAVLAAKRINAQRILVVGPAVSRFVWARHFEWAGYDTHVILTRRDYVTNNFMGVAICSYDLADPVRLAGVWDLLVLDECHYLKSLTAKRAVTVYGKNGLVHRSRRTWALSGTPAPNHAAELWPMMYVLGWTRLDYDAFVEKFCTGRPTPFKKFQITGTKNIPELKRLLQPVMLRRRKNDVLKDLPPITFSDLPIESGPVDDVTLEVAFFSLVHYDGKAGLEAEVARQKHLVETVVEGARVDNRMRQEGAETRILDALEGIYKSTTTLRRYTGLQKVPAVAELVTQELLGGLDKIVLFCIHRDVIEGLRMALARFKPVTLYGGTAPQRRERNIAKFQQVSSCRVFIGQVHAAGTAIDLTAAANAIFVECDWVPGNNAQAVMRIHRIGQRRPVHVRFAGLVGSIDEDIQRVLRRKTKQLVQLFDE